MIRLCKLVFVLLLIIPAKGQVNDNFNDGDYTQGTIWYADTGTFSVDSGWLHSQYPAASQAFYIATASSLAVETYWEFTVKLDFNTSSTNYIDAVLISDSMRLTGNFNGYFLRIGGSTDEVSLYRRQGNILTKLVDGVNGKTNHTQNLLRIKVSRDKHCRFTLATDTTATGNYYRVEGSITDTIIKDGAYFGFIIRQSTAAFHRKHWIDDIRVEPVVPDTVAPHITQVKVISDSLLEVSFDEAVDSASLLCGAYSLSYGYGYPLTVKPGMQPGKVYLYYPALISHANYCLSAFGIADTSGNCNSSDSLHFSYIIPRQYDILIHEIMADESPARQLPPYEYIELYNNSAYPLDLSGWILDDGTGTCTFPQITLLPDSFLIVTGGTGGNALSGYGRTLALNGFPSLNNDGDRLTLRSPAGKRIHQVEYSDEWYQHAVKKEGGWSLEMISPAYPCLGAENWSACINPQGGTPGNRNSVVKEVKDEQPPQVISSYPVDRYTVEVRFTESVDSVWTSRHLKAICQPGDRIAGVTITGSAFDKALLVFADSLEPKVAYRLYIDSAADCQGNILTGSVSDIGWPEPCLPGDLVINELLFDPVTGGEDFIELYNVSGKIIDVKGLYIANTDEEGLVKDAIILSQEGLLFFPGTCMAFGTNCAQLKTYYQPPANAHIRQVEKLPSWPDDEGAAVLLGSSLKELDRFVYNGEMHFPLLDDKAGVSLERINPERSAAERSNWVSATSAVNYATPGYRNSQYHTVQNIPGQISVESEIFSPDGDGFSDMLNIHYQLPGPGFMASVMIFDRAGRLVRHLLRNELLSPEGLWAWNGLDNNNTKVQPGIYVVYVELFNLKGETLRYKLPCAAVYKF